MRNARRRVRPLPLAEGSACEKREHPWAGIPADASLKGLTVPRVAVLAALLAFLLVGLVTAEARAAETRTIVAATDARISEGSPTTNYGNASTLSVDGDSSGGRDDSALLRWDLTTIAPGTKVGSASVTLTVTNSSPQTYEAYALKRGWAEPEVTWNVHSAGQTWETAGAQGSLDREATAAGSITPTSSGTRTFVISAAVVQGWVDDPSSNRGIVIADTVNGDGFDFYSSETKTASRRPVLTVDLPDATDTAPPETTIDSGPSGTVESSSASFSFLSSEAGSSFECALDAGAFEGCASPKNYSGLANGEHTFRVRATDAAGNVDTTPASRTWTVQASSSSAPSSVPDEGTAQVDGWVRTVLAVGDRVYLGGDFTHVNGVERYRLAAIDANTGQLTDWAPRANDRVRALAASPDGSRIYVGGSFTDIGGVARNRLAAVSAASGAVDVSWDARANSTVNALAVSGNRVYVGGDFSAVNGQSRARLALVDGTTGALDGGWAPSANSRVRGLALSGNGSRVYAGGDFSSVSGQSKSYLVNLDAITGAVDTAWQPPTPNGLVFSLAVSGGRVYTAEGGTGGVAAAYDATGTGARAWRHRGDGDVQAVTVLSNKVYLGGHFESFAGQTRRSFAAINADTGTLDAQWNPSANPAYPGVWALAPDASRTRLYAGGDFDSVSGRPHQNFAQFSG